jgi:mRNA-degrading endonuclease toxin of MazEF toxin-antitoxin module
MTPLRGHLYWVHLDKRRPALVISPNYRNEHASDVMIVPCTTRVVKSPTHVVLHKGEAGVHEGSVLKCEQLTTLTKDDIVDGPLGKALTPARIAEVERAIIRAIGIALPR